MQTTDDLLTRATRLHDPADALEAIRDLRVRLDRLESIHVENGLRAGWRWSDVAEALSLSKQAVHRRYARAMRERLEGTGAASPVRLALWLARQEAEAAGCRAVATHHVLLGLTRLDGAPVATRLAAAGVRADAARAALAQLGPEVEPVGAGPANGRLPFTAACRAALQRAVERGDDPPRPDDLLAALVDDGTCGAARVLARLGVDRVALRG
jgi:hypothetical protein